jgi:hypothetical protein
MFISVSDVPRVLAGITQAAEDYNSALSTLIATQNKFEAWWQGTLVAGLAAAPWSRAPGWDAANEGNAGLSIECTVDVPDRRLIYSKRTGRNSKRIDLAVKAGGTRSRAHLIELKLLDRGYSLADQVPGIV